MNGSPHVATTRSASNFKSWQSILPAWLGGSKKGVGFVQRGPARNFHDRQNTESFLEASRSRWRMPSFSWKKICFWNSSEAKRAKEAKARENAIRLRSDKHYLTQLIKDELKKNDQFYQYREGSLTLLNALPDFETFSIYTKRIVDQLSERKEFNEDHTPRRSAAELKSIIREVVAEEVDNNIKYDVMSAIYGLDEALKKVDFNISDHEKARLIEPLLNSLTSLSNEDLNSYAERDATIRKAAKDVVALINRYIRELDDKKTPDLFLKILFSSELELTHSLLESQNRVNVSGSEASEAKSTKENATQKLLNELTLQLDAVKCRIGSIGEAKKLSSDTPYLTGLIIEELKKQCPSHQLLESLPQFKTFGKYTGEIATRLTNNPQFSQFYDPKPEQSGLSMRGFISNVIESAVTETFKPDVDQAIDQLNAELEDNELVLTEGQKAMFLEPILNSLIPLGKNSSRYERDKAIGQTAKDVVSLISKYVKNLRAGIGDAFLKAFLSPDNELTFALITGSKYGNALFQELEFQLSAVKRTLAVSHLVNLMQGVELDPDLTAEEIATCLLRRRPELIDDVLGYEESESQGDESKLNELKNLFLNANQTLRESKTEEAEVLRVIYKEIQKNSNDVLLNANLFSGSEEGVFVLSGDNIQCQVVEPYTAETTLPRNGFWRAGRKTRVATADASQYYIAHNEEETLRVYQTDSERSEYRYKESISSEAKLIEKGSQRNQQIEEIAAGHLNLEGGIDKGSETENDKELKRRAIQLFKGMLNQSGVLATMSADPNFARSFDSHQYIAFGLSSFDAKYTIIRGKNKGEFFLSVYMDPKDVPSFSRIGKVDGTSEIATLWAPGEHIGQSIGSSISVVVFKIDVSDATPYVDCIDEFCVWHAEERA